MSACVASAPAPTSTYGTRAPTAKNFVATAIPTSPVMSSRAMIDQVTGSPPRRVALHAARIGGGPEAAAIARGGGEASFRPVLADLDDVAAAPQFLDGGFRHPPLHDDDAGPRLARPERGREMLRVPGGRVDGLLQVVAGMDVAQEELRNPLVLLVAARRAPGEVGLAVAQRHGRRQGRARALARHQRGRVALVEPEHLRPAAE